MEGEKSIRILRLSKKRWSWGDSISTEAQKPSYIKSSKSSGQKKGDGAVESIAMLNAYYIILDEVA